MEPQVNNETPMGRVWFVVVMTMCFTLFASWMWHQSGMRNAARLNAIEDKPVIDETARISAYLDVLRESGKEAAFEHLEKTASGVFFEL